MKIKQNQFFCHHLHNINDTNTNFIIFFAGTFDIDTLGI